MRRPLLLVAVLVVALLLVPVALAAGHGKGKAHKAHTKTTKVAKGKAKAKGKNRFQLNGVVQPAPTTEPGDGTGTAPTGPDATADPGDGTGTAVTDALLVLVTSGSRTVKAFRGQVLPVQIAPNARFVYATAGSADGAGDADGPLTLADIVAGARVHLGGVIDRSKPLEPVFIARRVILQRLPVAAPAETPSSEPSPSDPLSPEPVASWPS